MDRNAEPTLDDRAQTGRALLAPGTCVAGKYIICDVLGTGGSAIVYAAEQLGLKRVVAFKLYPATGEVAAALLQRFEREAQLLARVHHENVVAVFDAGGMPDGSPYLVVQRLHGDSLATRLAAGPLPIAEAVLIARQILSALVALGDAGITHRDIKPGNIVFDRLPDGRTVPKLVDFGIAKERGDEASRVLDAMVGTPRYMAPEQVRGEALDARCDLYALGATMYEMLTGRTPHSGETVQEIARATLFAPVTPPSGLRLDCPEGLSQIVMRALARDPDDRFVSARAMMDAVDAWRASRAAKPSGERRQELADTLPLGHQGALSARARGKRRKRRVAALTCLAAAGCLLLANEFDVRSRAQSPLAPPVQQSVSAQHDLLRALRARASQTSAQLMIQVRSSAYALLESVRGVEARRDAQAGDSSPALPAR
jgi:serine/threonine-protein kinase